jgi:hypothetical protein
MLATNPILYENVIKLDKDWSEVFDETNVHQMLYSLEIVEAILIKD